MRIPHPGITKEQLDDWFGWHNPKDGQNERYDAIRKSAKTFAATIVENTPPSADQTAAIRKIREAMMTANASIACEGV